MASPVVETVGTPVATASQGSNITLTAPASIADDDLLVAVIGRGDESGTITLTGWTQTENVAHDSNGALTILWKKAASESGDYTFAWSGGASYAYGAVLRISGWEGTTPFIGTKPTAATGDDAAPAPPASATVASDDYLAILAVDQEGKATSRFSTVPTGYTEQVDIGVSGAGAAAVSGGVGVWTKAFTGTSDTPGATTSSVTDGWAAQTLLVGPAASGSTTPKTIAATTTVTASLSRAATYAVPVAASVTATAALVKELVSGVTVAAASTITAAMGRTVTFYRTIAASTTVTATVFRVATHSRAVAVASTVVSSVGTAIISPRTIAAASTLTAGLSTLFIAFVPGSVTRLFQQTLATAGRILHRRKT
jgi:hypothetical protein